MEFIGKENTETSEEQVKRVIPFQESNTKYQMNHSNYLNIEKRLGPYVSPDTELLEKIDNSENHKSVVSLFPVALITSEEFTFLILYAELYQRDGYSDARAENSGMSFTDEIEEDTRRYKDVKICIIDESDGGRPNMKLNIGFKKYNILVASSLLVFPTSEGKVLFGPRCHEFLLDVNTLEKKNKKINNYKIDSKSFTGGVSFINV